MKKRAYLAALAACVALSAAACGTDQSVADNATEQQETTGTSQEEAEVSELEEQDLTVSEPEGFGTRLVSVDSVDKYITIADYKGLNLDNTVVDITDEQVEEQIKYNLQGERTTVTDSNESVKEGDLVTISYVGYVNGELLESEDLYDLTVGEGGMTEGFEEGLIGMKAGETKTLNLTFPEEFYSEELAGAQVTYTVTLDNFQRAPEIDDAYVAANTDASTLEEYREQVRASMESTAQAEAKENLRNIAWDTVLTNSEVMEYPEADLENASNEYKKQVMSYNNDSDMTLEEFIESQGLTVESFNDQCRQYAESKVKQNLIIQGIMDAEGLSLEDEQCLAIQDQLVEDMGVSSLAELIDAYGQTMIDEAIGLLRVEDFIVEHAVLEDVSADGALIGATVGTETDELYDADDAETTAIDSEE